MPDIMILDITMPERTASGRSRHADRVADRHLPVCDQKAAGYVLPAIGGGVGVRHVDRIDRDAAGPVRDAHGRLVGQGSEATMQRLPSGSSTSVPAGYGATSFRNADTTSGSNARPQPSTITR